MGKYGPANVEDTIAHGATDRKDDDDIDLSGCDEGGGGKQGSEEIRRTPCTV